MKQLTTKLMIASLAAGLLLAQAQTKSTDAKSAPAASASVPDELKQIENDWTAASKAKDAAKLGEILADSWVGLEFDGKTIDKAKALADLKAPGNSLDTIEMGPMKVRVFGNTAIVIGSDTEKSTSNGKDSSGKYIWTDVFVKQNGKWQAVSSQSTKVPK
jgi:ketosteroid isomerase-like protein